MPHKRRKKKNIKSHKIAYTVRNCSVVYGWWNPSAHVLLWAAMLFSLPLSLTLTDSFACCSLFAFRLFITHLLRCFFFFLLFDVCSREREREREATAN